MLVCPTHQAAVLIDEMTGLMAVVSRWRTSPARAATTGLLPKPVGVGSGSRPLISPSDHLPPGLLTVCTAIAPHRSATFPRVHPYGRQHVLGGLHALIGLEEHAPAVGEASGGVTLAPAAGLISPPPPFAGACFTPLRVAILGPGAALAIVKFSNVTLHSVHEMQGMRMPKPLRKLPAASRASSAVTASPRRSQ